MKRMIFALLAVFGFSAGMTPASSASLVAHIDVSSQTMTVSQSGQVLYNWKVSTGRNGYYATRHIPPATFGADALLAQI